MLLLLDNYDSFTFNLFQYLRELGEDVLVIRNDQITVEDCLEMDPDRIVISPLSLIHISEPTRPY